MKIWIWKLSKKIIKKLLEKKTRLPDTKVSEERKKLGLKKISSIRKGERIMVKLNTSLNIHKYNEDKEQKKLVF